MRTALLLACAALVLLAACGGDSDDPNPTVAPTETASPAPNPTIITATETPTTTSEPTTSPTTAPTGTPGATSTAPPEPTSTTAPDPVAGDVEGFPFGTAEVRAAAEAGGFGFQLVDERPPLCERSAVEGHAFWSANLAGADSGPLLVLWVYADLDALEADWDIAPGSAPSPRFDCELPSGFVYWHENLVMALETWLASGFDVPIGDEAPREHVAIQGFLSLTR